MTDFIEIDHLSFSYPTRSAMPEPTLKDIGLSIREGEFVAVIGHNGSGKSTLGKMFNALLIPDSGNVIVAGMNTREREQHASIRSMIGMVFQRPQDQIVATTVAEDTAFGPANLGLAPAEIRRRVSGALKATGLADYADRPSYMLSAGETQRMALAGVLAMQPKCVIFDETTAMLDPVGREMVLEQARALKAQGLTVIFITHLMDEAAQADRVVVLNEGRLVMDGNPRSIFSNEAELKKIGLELPETAELSRQLHQLIPHISSGNLFESDLFREIPQYSGDGQPQRMKHPASSTPKVIEVEHLTHVYLRGGLLAHPSLNGINYSVNQGSASGLMGSTGSGKSTLLQHLNALIKPQQGRVSVFGEDLSKMDLDIRQLRSRVGLVFQQPEHQIFEQYVGDEVAFAARNFKVVGKLSEIVRDAMNSVGLDFEKFKDRFTSSLSGGEQRKVALASVLAGQPEILLLDEPLAGLDPQSRQMLSNHLRNLKSLGLTLVVSTHQLEETMEWLDEISVLAKGKDVLAGDPGTVFKQIDSLAEFGLTAPLAVRVANAFRQKGWPIPEDAITSTRLIDYLGVLLEGSHP